MVSQKFVKFSVDHEKSQVQSRVKGCWGPKQKSRWGPLISASI